MSQKNRLFNKKKQSRQDAKQWVANEEPPSLRTCVQELTNIDGKKASYSMNGLKANVRIRAEQDVELLLQNSKLKLLSRPYDEVLTTTDRRNKHYKANEGRVIHKKSLPFGQYYGKAGSLKSYQSLKPNQLFDQVPWNLHGDFGMYPGSTKTTIAY